MKPELRRYGSFDALSALRLFEGVGANSDAARQNENSTSHFLWKAEFKKNDRGDSVDVYRDESGFAARQLLPNRFGYGKKTAAHHAIAGGMSHQFRNSLGARIDGMETVAETRDEMPMLRSKRFQSSRHGLF